MQHSTLGEEVYDLRNDRLFETYSDYFVSFREIQEKRTQERTLVDAKKSAVK